MQKTPGYAFWQWNTSGILIVFYCCMSLLDMLKLYIIEYFRKGAG